MAVHCAATWKLWTETGKGKSGGVSGNRSLGGTLQAFISPTIGTLPFKKRLERLLRAIPNSWDRFVEKRPENQ